MPDSLNTRSAAAVLQITERQVRRLIASGRLQAVGAGHGRKITVASVEQCLQNKFGHEADIHWKMSALATQNGAVMKKLMKHLPALSKPEEAARRLGIPEAE